MHTIRLFIGLFILATLLGGCSAKATEEKQWEEVMAIHDEVMPKMSSINRLSRTLRDYIEQTDSIPAEQRQRLEAGIQQLQSADEQMWEWMNNLKQLDGLREEMDHAAILNYLATQKEAIETVRQSMETAIDQGEKLVKELPEGASKE